MGFAALSFLQYFNGQITYFGDALAIAAYATLVGIAIAMGFTWALNKHERPDCADNLYPLAVAMLIGATFSVLISITQVFDPEISSTWILSQDYYRRPGANIGQPNHLATLLVMGVASLIYLAQIKRISKPLTLFLAIILTLGLAVSESRAGILGATVLALWYTVRPPKIVHSGLVWAMWAFMLAMAYIWPSFITYIQEGGATLDLSVAATRTASLRLRIWPQLIEAAMLRPWFGWGLRGVSVAHNQVLNHYAQGEPYTYAHNAILELVIGIGIPGACVFFAFLVVWGFRRLRLARCIETVFCVAVAIPFVCHSLVEFPYAYAYFLLPTMLAVGYLEGKVADQHSLQITLIFSRIAAGLVLFVLAWSAVEYLRVEEDFRVARMEALRVGKTPSEYERPVIHLLTQLDAMLLATRTVPAPGMSGEQVEQLRLAAMRFPWTAIQNRYALALALNGNFTEASRQLMVMRAMYGEKTYKGIRENWMVLAQTQFPQLSEFALP